jgi:hypothetical protein
VEDRGVRLRGDVWDREEKLDDTARENLDTRFTVEEVKNVVDKNGKG